MHTCQNAHDAKMHLMPKCTHAKMKNIPKCKTFPNATMPNATLRQVFKHARKVLNRTPTYELTAAKLRKGLKGRGIRTSAVFQLPCHPQGPLLCLQKASIYKCQEFQLLQCYKCQTKAYQLLQLASAKLTKLLPILKCHTKAWKLLQFTSARKTCKMLQPTIACQLLPLTGAE